jgi:ABC-type transporter Mla MlaB component
MAYELPAVVDFPNLVEVREAGKTHIDGSDPAEFDLSGLTEANSAVVALLIAWFRYAHARGKVVRFLQVPPGVMNIIEVSDLTEVLPIADPEARAEVPAGSAAEREV